MSASSFGRIVAATLAAAATVGTLAAATVGTLAATAVAAPPATALEVETGPAAPAARMRTFDPADFAGRAAQLPPGLTEAVRRDLGQSPDEYLAAAAAARLAGEVVGSLGDTVRSAWLDGQILHVAVTDRSATIAARTAGAEVQVGDVLADALGAARSQDKLAYVDRTAERVVAVGAQVRGAPVGQVRMSAQSGDHRGGTGFAVHDQLADYHCSTAFGGIDADGDARLLTAGHCATGPEGPFTSGARELAPPAPLSTAATPTWPGLIGADLGDYVPDSVAFGGGRDAALLEVDGDVRPEVDGWSPGAGDEPALTVHDSVTAIAGAPVCSAGVASGWTCGHVLDAQGTVAVSGQPVTGFLFDACVLPGDSGGAVVVGQYALGLSSGSTWTGPACADGDPAAGGDDVAVGYAISGGPDSVEGLYGDGFDLAVRVGRPEVTAPADGAGVGLTPTITGTADAAAGAVVTVRIEDGPTVETPVEPDGRWSVTLGTPLDPGTYEYEATTSFRPATSDRTVTSGETTGEFEAAAVADLAVTRPAPGHVSADGRLDFEGTGQPGATVRLTVGGEELATTTVGDDGTWSLRAGTTRPAGRFDAVLTQHLAQGFAASAEPDADTLAGAGMASASTPGSDAEPDRDADVAVTVANVGVAPSAPVVSAPLGAIPAADAATVSGAGLPGAAVAVRVAASGADVSAAPELRAEAAADGTWSVRLDAPLTAGRHVAVATQTIDDLTSEPSKPVVLEVADASASASADDPAAATDDARSGLPGGVLAAALGVLAAGAAAAAAVVWRRRSAR